MFFRKVCGEEQNWRHNNKTLILFHDLLKIVTQRKVTTSQVTKILERTNERWMRLFRHLFLKSGRLSFSTPFGAPPWARITWAQALEPLPSWTSDRWWRLRWRTTGRASCCRRRRCWRWCRRPEEMTCYQWKDVKLFLLWIWSWRLPGSSGPVKHLGPL